MTDGFHGCPHSFDELAKTVLPQLFGELIYNMRDMKKLIAHEANQLHEIPKSRGCYIFFEGDEPLYVGITRNLRGRIAQHLSNNRTQANLCVRFAASSVDVKVAQVVELDDFPLLFEQARTRLAACSLTWIEVGDAMTLYLLEPYVAMKLDTQQFNRFDVLQILSPRAVGKG